MSKRMCEKERERETVFVGKKVRKKQGKRKKRKRRRWRERDNKIIIIRVVEERSHMNIASTIQFENDSIR